MWQDLRFAVRLLLNNPTFAVIAVLTLAVGIASNTTVFSWVDGMLLHPYGSATGGSRLAVLESVTASAPNGGTMVSFPDYEDYRKNLKSASGLALHREEVFTLGETGDSRPVWGQLVSGNFFSVLGVRAVAGRLFLPEEDTSVLGANPIVVISDSLWRKRFRSDPKAIGKTLRINRHELTIVGVAPADFRGTAPGLAFDVWIPLTMGVELNTMDAESFRTRNSRSFGAVALLKDGITIAQASTEADFLSSNLEKQWPKTNEGIRARVVAPMNARGGGPELLLKPLLILMGVSVLVLMIVCANVANLLLARSVARRRELTIRLALGAGGWRLARQLLTETLILAAGGAVLGLVFTYWSAGLLPSLVPKIGVNVAQGFHLNPRILMFVLLICTFVVVLCGSAPALFWSRANVHASLKEGGRSGKHGSASHRWRGLLVTVEVALAAIALAGAGLFMRSFRTSTQMNPGFETANVTLLRFYLTGAGFTMPEFDKFCQRLQERLRQTPGIVEASFGDMVPLGMTAGPYNDVDVEGYVPAFGENMNVNRTRVSAGYFDTLRLKLTEGRDFRDTDDAASPRVIIVNQAFVKHFLSTGSVIGRKIRFNLKWATVAGVVKDSKYFSVTEPPRPHFYAPLRQRGSNNVQLLFLVKTAGSSPALSAAIRREVVAAGGNAATSYDVMTLKDWTEVTLLPQKIAASLLSVLGLLAVLLASVGLYSVMAYAVSQRIQEIGVRMALGAERRDVLFMVLRQGLLLTLPGLLMGGVMAILASRLVSNMLVGIDATDPLTFGATGLLLCAVAIVASYVPAMRATRVDPMVALHAD